eukprot:12163215-Alexandrium_andersonii.AAC.1
MQELEAVPAAPRLVAGAQHGAKSPPRFVPPIGGPTIIGDNSVGDELQAPARIVAEGQVARRQ